MSELLSDKLRRRRLQEEAERSGEEVKYDFPDLDWSKVKDRPARRDDEGERTYPVFQWDSDVNATSTQSTEYRNKIDENSSYTNVESKASDSDETKPSKLRESKTSANGMPALLDLFLTFARVGGMTFGGGYAMLPILQREIVENKGWATEEELADYFAIGQCTPGIIAVNTATFIGKKEKGVLGGIVATLGVVFPSLIIISLIAGLIQSFADIEWVAHAFAGIRVCVCVLIFNSVVKLFRKAVIDLPTTVIFVAILLGASLLSISPIVFVLIAGACGIIVQMAGLSGIGAIEGAPSSTGGSSDSNTDNSEGGGEK